MNKATSGFILAMLVVGSLGVAYLAGTSSPGGPASTSTESRQTSTSTTTKTSNTASTVASSGLELSLDLNATSMDSGQTLEANVTLYNTLDRSLSLSPFDSSNSTNSISAWDNYDFLCGVDGPDGYLASFAVLPGRFSAGNLSDARPPLQLAAVSDLPSCIGIVWPQDEVISFLPRSDNASIPGTYPGWAPVTLNVSTAACIAAHGSPICRRGSGLYGYWNTSSSICCPAPSTAPDFFRYLTPGEYTLAAEDVWGQSVFAYFQVVQGPSPSLAVAAQESPFSGPESPIVGVTLADLSDAPITSLSWDLPSVPPHNGSGPLSYSYALGLSPSNPLLPGQAVQSVITLQGNLFDIGVEYPLTISGTLANGTAFAYTQEIQFSNSPPSW